LIPTPCHITFIVLLLKNRPELAELLNEPKRNLRAHTRKSTLTSAYNQFYLFINTLPLIIAKQSLDIFIASLSAGALSLFISENFIIFGLTTFYLWEFKRRKLSKDTDLASIVGIKDYSIIFNKAKKMGLTFPIRLQLYKHLQKL
jgi:hypothetical protein